MSANKMVKFPKISSFRKAQKFALSRGHEEIEYLGTPKLHGTNACIARVDGRIHCQSRNRVIEPGDSDNAGFAAWVAGLPRELLDEIFGGRDNLYVYGEWIGKGICKGTAVNTLDEKQFVVFRVLSLHGDELRWFLPFFTAPLTFGTEEAAALGYRTMYTEDYRRAVVDFREGMPGIIEAVTENAGESCPFAANHLGIKGIGEGYVWAPADASLSDELWFKTKASAYLEAAGERKPKGPSKNTEARNAAYQFAREVVTPRRLEQGVEYLVEMDAPIARESTGTFVKWIQGDILDELSVEIEEAGIDRSTLSSAIGKVAAPWFLGRAS